MGAGQPCVVCDEMISSEQAEVTAHVRTRDPDVFHVRCFLRWWELVGANRGRQ